MEHHWKLLLVFIGGFTISEAAYMQCYKNQDLTEYEVACPESPETLIESSCIDIDKPTIVYCFGFNGSNDSTSTIGVLSQIDQEIYNVILWNWQKEAQGEFLPKLAYGLHAVPNTIEVGKTLGRAMYRLYEHGLDLDRVHMMGHSLGAQLLGYTGREMIEMGTKVARITGLDPARPLYQGLLPIFTPVGKECAKFVDIIHTDPGRLGVDEGTGTVDIWCNYGHIQDTDAQPGCEPDKNQTLDDMHLCNHERVLRFFSESFSNPSIYVASKAPSYEEWTSREGNFDASEQIYMGFDIDTTATGDYYISTDECSPYGLGEAGLKPRKIATAAEKKNKKKILGLL